MNITDEKSLADIQEEFSSKFPYLKIEFYKEKHQNHEGSPAEELLQTRQKIGDIRQMHTNGDLSINGHLKVSTLEREMHDRYGMNVQVFRRSGAIWLQTISTDDWTLTEQNEKGLASVQ